MLEAFVGQFYSNKKPPKLVLISHKLPNQELVKKALIVRADRNVVVSCPQRGTRRTLIESALRNASDALARRLSESATQRKLLDGVAELFNLDAPPKRIEVYDNSHISGTNALGAMIVSGEDGFEKNAYRKFNIKDPGTVSGDDYAMMREVLTRRLSRALKEDPDRAGNTWPDLILIDGGPGQLSVALEVLTSLASPTNRSRPSPRVQTGMPGASGFTCRIEPHLPCPCRTRCCTSCSALDEAHRFAIGSHRARRGKDIAKSVIDEIPGVGAKRKRALLNHFGSATSVARAGLSDLETVDGISHTVARRIYDYFNVDG